jgi:hypothetical protein
MTKLLRDIECDLREVFRLLNDFIRVVEGVSEVHRQTNGLNLKYRLRHHKCFTLTESIVEAALPTSLISKTKACDHDEYP